MSVAILEQCRDLWSITNGSQVEGWSTVQVGTSCSAACQVLGLQLLRAAAAGRARLVYHYPWAQAAAPDAGGRRSLLSTIHRCINWHCLWGLWTRARCVSRPWKHMSIAQHGRATSVLGNARRVYFLRRVGGSAPGPSFTWVLDCVGWHAASRALLACVDEYRVFYVGSLLALILLCVCCARVQPAPGHQAAG